MAYTALQVAMHADDVATNQTLMQTHDVRNQAASLVEFNLYDTDLALQQAVRCHRRAAA